jgi:uncharacterized protein DUF6895
VRKALGSSEQDWTSPEQQDWTTTVHRAIGWVLRNVEEFDPFRHSPVFNTRNGQRLSELALMLHCHLHCLRFQDAGDVATVVDLLQSVQFRPEFRERVVSSPSEFVLYSDVYAVLAEVGRIDLKQKDLLQRVIDAGFLDAIERVPHRMMDVRLSLDWAGLGHNWPDMQALASSSIVGRGVPSALYLDEAACYALTHVVMFSHDFGTRTRSIVIAHNTAGWRVLLSGLLLSAAQKHQWDLLAELVLCWDCLELEHSDVYHRAWAHLTAIQTGTGAIPGPEGALTTAPQIEGNVSTTSLAQREFLHCYHTTLVTIIAGTARANRPASDGRVEPGSPPRALPALKDHVADTRNWMVTTFDKFADRARPDVLLRTLLGWWICDSISDHTWPSPDWQDRASHVNNHFSHLWQEGQEIRIVGRLELATAALLLRCGLASAQLTAAVIGLARTLAEASTDGHSSDVGLFELRFLLHRLGLGPQPAPPPVSLAFELANELKLDAAWYRVVQIVEMVGAATGYGTMPAGTPQVASAVSDLLLYLAMHQFREYDLVAGCQLVRAAWYLMPSHCEAMDQCFRFLLLHRGPDGAAGFYGAEHAVLRDQGSQIDMEADVLLPVTLSWLWTLAEVEGNGWHLYEKLAPQPLAERIGLEWGQ